MSCLGAEKPPLALAATLSAGRVILLCLNRGILNEFYLLFNLLAQRVVINTSGDTGTTHAEISR